MPDNIASIVQDLTTVEQVLASDFSRTGFRTGGTNAKVHENLGLLSELPGTWRGSGFNLIARPFFKAGAGQPPFFLEINATRETLDFNSISGDIPNRGSEQDDVNIHGVRYLQQVIDAELDSGIHVETGMWIRVPATTVPAIDESYVRQSTIPHGDSLLAQSSFARAVEGGPVIKPVDTTPFTGDVVPGLNDSPATPLDNAHGYLDQYLKDALPPVMSRAFDPVAVIKDPTIVLRAAIAKQTISSTVVLAVSTTGAGSLVNIPFVQKNANATQLDAIFWLETVEREDGEWFVQLQYVQRVILDFVGIKWPHVSIATLRKV